MPNTGTIAFTQYLRPFGTPRVVSVDRPIKVFRKACEITDKGYRLECEVPHVGEVVLTITNDDGDQAVRVVKNGPEVLAAVDDLIMSFSPV